MAETNGNGRKLEWLYRACVLAALGWLVARVEGMDADLAQRDGRIAVVEQQNVDQGRRITDLETWRYSFPMRPR